MKKLLTILGTTAVMAAMTSCQGNGDKDAAAAELELQRYKDSVRTAADTAGLAEYRQWKSQNELVADSQNMEQQYAATAPARSTASRSSAARSSSAHRSSTARRSSSSSSNGGSYSSTSSNTAKRGWSKAAKGAVIGGAGGAITGAVINKKNRAAGAVVGGVVGGVVGYGVGRHKDKKDGRY